MRISGFFSITPYFDQNFTNIVLNEEATLVHSLDIYTIILLKSVCVRKLQVAILAQSSREMSLTVRIVWQYILSRVRVSVRPSIFLYVKNIHKLSQWHGLAQVSIERKGA